MFLGIACHTDAEVGGQSVDHCGVKVSALVQVADHAHQFVGVGKTFRVGNEESLSGNGVTTQGHHIVDAQKVQVEHLTFNLVFRCTAADDVGHDVDAKPLHDGGHNGYCSWAFGQGHSGIGAIGVFVVFHLVTVTGDI